MKLKGSKINEYESLTHKQTYRLLFHSESHLVLYYPPQNASDRCMIKQVIIWHADISTFFFFGGGGGVSTSIIAPKQICTLQEPKGCMLFYGSYTSTGPAKTLCPLGRIGP